MRVDWSPEAIADLKALRRYIGRDNPLAAKRVSLRILEVVEGLLPSHPEMGRPGRMMGTRELVVVGAPYVIPYRIRAGAVEIIRVLHSAQRWPPV